MAFALTLFILDDFLLLPAHHERINTHRAMSEQGKYARNEIKTEGL
jgi:hypothetical protein